MNEKEYFIKKTTLTDRPLERYRNILDIPEDMKGEVVLDIGSGRCLRFARKAAKEDITVISVNPALHDKKNRDKLTPLWKRILHKEDTKPPAIAAISQKLPIKDESVDRVTSLFAVPFHLPSETVQNKQWLEEMLRVVKPGGEVDIYPLEGFTQSLKEVKDMIREVLDEKEYPYDFIRRSRLFKADILKVTKPNKQDK